MKAFLVWLFIIPYSCFSQHKAIEEYLGQNGNAYRYATFEPAFDDRLIHNDLVFFGYIHGAEAPQRVEYKLLEYLVAHGFQYYVPEVDVAQAYFLNRYLVHGDEAFLRLVTYYQKKRVPQDASVQFMDKWRKIYGLNKTLPKNKKIKVIGTDLSMIALDPSLAITYLAYIAPEQTNNAMIDSLVHFKNTNFLDLEIWSGKPAYELVQATKKYTYDFVYPVASKYQFGRKFISYYEEHKAEVLEAFGDHGTSVEYLFSRYSWRDREAQLADQFQKNIVPKIKEGAKVFSVFGYTHVMQGPINGKKYLAKLFKEKNSSLKVASILGLLAKSRVLDERKYCRSSEEIKGLHDLVFEKSNYCGFKQSRKGDGDSLWERILGIKYLKKATKNKDGLMISLIKQDSPFRYGKYFLDFKRGGKHFQTDSGLSTIDYFQYVIYMQNSRANIPFEEVHGNQ